MTLSNKNFTAQQACGSINVAANWTRAIGMGKDFDAVLAGFQKLVGAETVQIVRQLRNFDRTRLIARRSETAGKLFGHAPRSYASSVLGAVLHKSSLGSLFLMTEMRADHEPPADLAQTGVQEVGVISLCTEHEFSDFLEFIFERSLLNHNRYLLEILGASLSESWRLRTPGVVAARLAGYPFPAAHESEKKFTNILGSDNPTHLTRCEYRVCVLIQEGCLPNEIAEILQISKSTFSSHLRAIYSKTHTSGHVELVHFLHRSGNKVSQDLMRNGIST